MAISQSVTSMPAWMSAASLGAYGLNLTDADVEAMQATVSARTHLGGGMQGRPGPGWCRVKIPTRRACVEHSSVPVLGVLAPRRAAG